MKAFSRILAFVFHTSLGLMGALQAALGLFAEDTLERPVRIIGGCVLMALATILIELRRIK